MRGDRDDDAAGGPRAAPQHRSGLRTAGLTVGFLLAVAATVVVFVTDDPQVLRVAVVGAAWAFVLAALAPARRAAAPGDGDAGDAATESEAGLRLAAELALAREAAAGRADELRSESGLRREAEESMRAQLDALRGELAEVALLRRDMAEVTELRREVAQLAELRTGLVQLPDLRHDLAQLAELRADVGRLRTELSGEMLVERVMLRTQSIRTGPATPDVPVTRTIDAWSGPAPALPEAPSVTHYDDLTGGGPTRQSDEVRVRQPAPSAVPPPPPLDWLAEHSLVEPAEAGRTRDAGAAGSGPRQRRSDDRDPPAAPPTGEKLTVQRPVVQRARPPVPGSGEASAESGAAGERSSRPAQVPAEGGGALSSGGRRRRRYRDDDGGDDVLSRVLGRG
jgi:hypothetical protein